MIDNIKRIAVIGGTFAPPTIAHCALLRRGMEFTESDIGLFIPSSKSYMMLWRQGKIPDEIYLNNDIRIGMLNAVCAYERDMYAYYDEMMKTESAYTFDTLNDISAKYSAKVSLIMGEDLLGGFSRWYRVKELTEKFNVFVAPRGDDDLNIAISKTGLNNISAMPFSSDYEGISATEARKLLANKDFDEAAKYVHPAAMDYVLSHESILK